MHVAADIGSNCRDCMLLLLWQERVIVRFWGESQLVGWPYFRFMRWRLRSFIFQAHLLLLFCQGRSGRNDFAREAFGLYSDLAIPAVCDKAVKRLRSFSGLSKPQNLWEMCCDPFRFDVYGHSICFKGSWEVAELLLCFTAT